MRNTARADRARSLRHTTFHNTQARRKHPMAAVDYFLKIEGIEGESTDKTHKNSIQVESFSFGETQAGSASHGSGGGAGKVQMQDFHFVKKLDRASPSLF